MWMEEAVRVVPKAGARRSPSQLARQSVRVSLKTRQSSNLAVMRRGVKLLVQGAARLSQAGSGPRLRQAMKVQSAPARTTSTWLFTTARCGRVSKHHSGGRLEIRRVGCACHEGHEALSPVLLNQSVACVRFTPPPQSTTADDIKRRPPTRASGQYGRPRNDSQIRPSISTTTPKELLDN
ncbi:hypothetical protein BCR34DRAFT_306035 [Clohesyomyces aquaticus]|uniref:Uncharacterized protein n=1 Tax=Clohesyomyces aquaticus TaxID=1231657 RepID=A0A1Y1ZPS6_9PLEO|nr:hypothetical protein BCR34DRAFT_306035 [Clohesyomyces aquaticus]